MPMRRHLALVLVLASIIPSLGASFRTTNFVVEAPTPQIAYQVAQAAEVFWQLRGEAGTRQVPDARVGLTHNNSGMGEHVVMVYGSEAA